MGRGGACTVYTEASGTRGWGATLGAAFIRCAWPKTEMREGVNWKELWVLREPMKKRGPQMSGKLVLARMDSSAAVSYANRGAGRPPQVTTLPDDVKELEVSLRRAAAALRIAGRRRTVADAPSRSTVWAHGEDQYPDRELRLKVCGEGGDHCGRMGVDMMASDVGWDAWCSR